MTEMDAPAGNAAANGQRSHEAKSREELLPVKRSSPTSPAATTGSQKAGNYEDGASSSILIVAVVSQRLAEGLQSGSHTWLATNGLHKPATFGKQS